MVKISNFRKNSDFAAIKKVGRYTMHLSGSAGTRSDGYQYSTTITVPAGVYIENVTLSTSLTSGSIPSSFYLHQFNSAGAMLFIQVHQNTNTQYRLLATVGTGGASSVSVPAFTVDAILNLSVSPFN